MDIYNKATWFEIFRVENPSQHSVNKLPHDIDSRGGLSFFSYLLYYKIP